MLDAAWKIVTGKAGSDGKILVQAADGRRFSLDRAELRAAVECGTAVYSVSRFRLTLAYVDAGRFM
jgi:hypothetical protein